MAEGLFSSLFGGGETPGPTRRLGLLDRFQANYAPNVYEAKQQQARQAATYGGMLENKASPAQSQAMAVNPQYFAAGNEAYMPSAPQVEWKQDPYTGQYGAYAVGRGAGGKPYVSEVPIGAPPGTTTQPQQSGRAPQQSESSGQQVQQPASNKAGGDIASQVAAAREQGADPEALIKAFVPPGIQSQVQGLRSGKILPDQLKGQTAESIKRLTQLVDPDWNETKAAGAHDWIKQYMGGQVRDNLQATNTSLDSLNDTLDKALGLKNADVYNSYLSSGLNKVRQMSGQEAVSANEFNTANHALAQNLVKMMSGSKRPVGQATINDWKERLGSGMRPVEMAGAAGGLVDEIDSRIKELEQERNARVGTPGDYPIKTPDYDQKIQLLRQKVEQLKGQKSGPGSPIDVLSGKGFNEAAPAATEGWSNFRVGK